jgi:hypothetical protein
MALMYPEFVVWSNPFLVYLIFDNSAASLIQLPIKHGNNKALKTNDAESGNVVEN